MNISMIMSGIDPQTKKFTEPPNQIKNEIAALKADKSVPEADKKEGLAQLEAALKNAKPIQFKENITLVLKYFDSRRSCGSRIRTCDLRIRDISHLRRHRRQSSTRLKRRMHQPLCDQESGNRRERQGRWHQLFGDGVRRATAPALAQPPPSFAKRKLDRNVGHIEQWARRSRSPRCFRKRSRSGRGNCSATWPIHSFCAGVSRAKQSSMTT
jgi:hypothetical protein